MQTPHGYLKQRRSKLKGAQALGHMAQQSGCWHEVSRSALDMDPGPNRGTRRWSCGLRAVGTWTEKGGNGDRTSNGKMRVRDLEGWSPCVLCVYLHPSALMAARRVGRQADSRCIRGAGWTHLIHRAAPATLARNRSFSTAQWWKPCGPPYRQRQRANQASVGAGSAPGLHHTLG
jgi:hypothetical protein